MSNTAPSSPPHAARPRAERHRRAVRRRVMSFGPVALVLVALLVLVAVHLGTSRAPAAAEVERGPSGTTPLSAAVQRLVTHVPADAARSSAAIRAPLPVLGASRPLRLDGKPEVVFIGAEYCPFCAAERWPLVVALSRFGTFHGLQATHSASGDEYPDTASLSFFGATFSSSYLSFRSVELETNEIVGGSYPTLERPSAEESRLFATYDAPPYTTEAGSIPFIDFGGRFIDVGASYDPGLLAGESGAQIAHSLARASTSGAVAIDATAQAITNELCTITDGRPASACRLARTSPAH